MSESHRPLEGRTAVVTGASRGIGAAIARRLGALGATVVGTATTPEGAARLEAALREAGVDAHGEVLDVADPESVAGFVARVEERHAPVTVLVNNAGITRDNLLLRMKDEEWEAVLRTNLDSVYRLSRAFLRGMM
ncbi:MAG TPA: SDR family NAD(P)-dependent oxidoreductase, partial [Chromatiales bacterium]|nr:SDR family NAD(P)-dependent oxidoreductase [Chromatiales bacterium]